MDPTYCHAPKQPILSQKMRSGIYTITSPSSGQYVGSAVDFEKRWRVHRHHLRRGTHNSRALQRAFKKYGADSLRFSRIIVCAKEQLIFFEQRTINVLNPRYNSCRVAGSPLGTKHTVETKERMAALRRGAVLTPEHRRKISLSMMGKKNGQGWKASLDQRVKLSRALRGKLHADSFQANITADQIRLICAEYQNGIGLVKLADAHRVNHKILRRYLVLEGIEIRRLGHNLRRAAAQ